MTSRYFDLNIQRVLEHWSVSEALREVIANALDEQALTRTADVEIVASADAVWHIRDSFYRRAASQKCAGPFPVAYACDCEHSAIGKLLKGLTF